MPERLPTAKPLVMVGSNLESGTPNTGQLPFTQGGSRVACVFSGAAGGDANLWVGGGRLDKAQLHPWAVSVMSGKPVIFYDAAAAVSGGPLPASGHKIVGVLAFDTNAADQIGSGLATGSQGGKVREFGFVFTSGLCCTGTSGQPGFSVSFTPVISG